MMMSRENYLTKELFIQIAKNNGLTPEGPYADKLYDYVNVVMSSVRALEELDVSGVEPLTLSACFEEAAK
jgi:Asp-tRNA(Asn)/Glu-tRNA(Gln) amidotransferase C subunit